MDVTAGLEEPPSPRTALAGSWADFGCRVNALDVPELFAWYGRTRFMYAAKRARIAPYLPLIAENWRRALRAGELLCRVVTYDEDGGGRASGTAWRSNCGGWTAQHFVSAGTLAGGRAIALSFLAASVSEGDVGSHQVWYRPDKPLPAQVFGGLARCNGPDKAAVLPSEYVMLPLAAARAAVNGAGARVEELDGGACPELAQLARLAWGEVYARAEALDGGDLRLGALDGLYRLVGLRRYRRIWVQYDGSGRLRAAVVAYRGPLGLNFSFLENRCDLLLDPALDENEAKRAAQALLAAAAGAYADFELGAIPVVTPTRLADALVAAGAERVAPYTQAVCLSGGFAAWYAYIDALYEQRLDGRGRPARSAL